MSRPPAQLVITVVVIVNLCQLAPEMNNFYSIMHHYHYCCRSNYMQSFPQSINLLIYILAHNLFSCIPGNVSLSCSLLYFFVIGLVGLCCKPQPLVIIIIIINVTCFVNHSSSSFLKTCPHHHNVFLWTTFIMSSIINTKSCTQYKTQHFTLSSMNASVTSRK